MNTTDLIQAVSRAGQMAREAAEAVLPDVEFGVLIAQVRDAVADQVLQGGSTESAVATAAPAAAATTKRPAAAASNGSKPASASKSAARSKSTPTKSARAGKPRAASAAGKSRSAKIREWAAAEGIEVNARGRISQKISDQYDAAQAG